MAAGSAELLRSLPATHPARPRILDGYGKMMASLLAMQGADGLWRQLIDHPEAWPETSGTGMFAFAMVTGVKNGWLDAATYGPAARKAWLGLVKYIDADGNVGNVCAGTNKGPTVQYLPGPAAQPGGPPRAGAGAVDGVGAAAGGGGDSRAGPSEDHAMKTLTCCAVLLLTAASAVADDTTRLWYRQPAAAWNQALPVGNGRLGAMVFGGVPGRTHPAQRGHRSGRASTATASTRRRRHRWPRCGAC